MSNIENANQILEETDSTKPQLTETPEKERDTGLRARVKASKKSVIIAAGTVGTVLLGLGFLKWCRRDPETYSSEWFSAISDEALKAEREIVRKEYAASGEDHLRAVYFQNLLFLIDSVLGKRAWNGEKPSGVSYHREDGYNLYRPD